MIFDGFKIQFLISWIATFDKILIAVVHNNGICQLIPKRTTLDINLGKKLILYIFFQINYLSLNLIFYKTSCPTPATLMSRE